MYSHEIKQLLEAKQYLLDLKDYIEIMKTSPQVNFIKYNTFEKNFQIETDDKYSFKFKIKEINNKT